MDGLRALGVAIALLGLSACASTTLDRQEFKSYALGAERSANIGDAFLVDQSGYVETVKTWVGLLYSPDGWARKKVYSEDFLRKELVYSGRSGPSVEVSYREFRGGMAAPAFFQTLKYDLEKSKVIRFQRYQIEVIDAGNESIRYKVLGDR